MLLRCCCALLLNKKVATENKEKSENVWKLRKFFIFLQSDRVHSLYHDVGNLGNFQDVRVVA